MESLYTVFINGGRAERPGFECMNARLGRPENHWRAHRLVFYFGFVTRISHYILLKLSIFLEDIGRKTFS